MTYKMAYIEDGILKRIDEGECESHFGGTIAADDEKNAEEGIVAGQDLPAAGIGTQYSSFEKYYVKLTAWEMYQITKMVNSDTKEEYLPENVYRDVYGRGSITSECDCKVYVTDSNPLTEWGTFRDGEYFVVNPNHTLDDGGNPKQELLPLSFVLYHGTIELGRFAKYEKYFNASDVKQVRDGYTWTINCYDEHLNPITEIQPSLNDFKINIAVHDNMHYYRLWPDGYKDQDTTGAQSAITGVKVIIVGGDAYTCTYDGTYWYATIPANNTTSDRTLKIEATEEYGNTGTEDIIQRGKTWNNPVITGIYSIEDIPAGGGSVSSCVVSYTQTSNAGDSIYDNAYVEFSAISADSLGTTETTERTWRGSHDVTITVNGKVSDAYTVNVYQAINAITKRNYSSFYFSLPWSTYTIPAKGGSNGDLTPTSVSQTVDYTYTSTATKTGVAVSVSGHYTTYYSRNSEDWTTSFADVAWSKDSRGTSLVENDEYLGHIYVKLVGDSSCGNVSTSSDARSVYFQHNTKDKSTYSNPWVSLSASSATLIPNGSDSASASVLSVGQSIKYTWTSGVTDSDWTSIPLTSYTTYYGTSASPTSTTSVNITAENIGANLSDAKTLGTIYVRIKSADSNLYSSDATMVVYQSANEITNRAYSAFSFTLPWSTYTIPANGGTNGELSPSNVTQTADYTYTNSSKKSGVSIATSGHYTTYWSNDGEGWTTTFASVCWNKDSRGTSYVESDEYLGHIYVRLVGDSSCGGVATTSDARSVYYQHNTKDQSTYNNPWLTLSSTSATLMPNGSDSASASIASVGQSIKYTWTSGVQDSDWTAIPLTSYTAYYGTSATPSSTSSVSITAENIGANLSDYKSLGTIYVRVVSADSGLSSSDATMTVYQYANQITASNYSSFSFALPWSSYTIPAKGGSNASLDAYNVSQTVDYTYTNSSKRTGVQVSVSGHYTTYWSNNGEDWSASFADKAYSRDTRGTSYVESDEYIGHIYVRLVGDSSCGSVSTTSGACNVYFQHNTKDSMTWEAPTLTISATSATLVPNGTDSASASISSVGQRAKYTWTSGVTDGDWTSIPLTSYTTYYGTSVSPTSTTSVTVTSENAGAAYLAAKTLATIYVRIYSPDSGLYSSDATMTVNQAENKVVSSTYATRSIVLSLSTTSVSASGASDITAAIYRYKSRTDIYTNGQQATETISVPDTVSSPYSYISVPSSQGTKSDSSITIYSNTSLSAREIVITATYDGYSSSATISQAAGTPTDSYYIIQGNIPGTSVPAYIFANNTTSTASVIWAVLTYGANPETKTASVSSKSTTVLCVLGTGYSLDPTMIINGTIYKVGSTIKIYTE